MLEQVLAHLNNWFLAHDGIQTGTFTVKGGGITLPFLQDGQYFRIAGSVFNDGLYQYRPDMEALIDESFDGTIWALAVPKDVIALAEEISAWQEKNASVVTSPYTSESFGGYSYTKAANANTGSMPTWQSTFGSRLARWRKLP